MLTAAPTLYDIDTKALRVAVENEEMNRALNKTNAQTKGTTHQHETAVKK